MRLSHLGQLLRSTQLSDENLVLDGIECSYKQNVLDEVPDLNRVQKTESWQRVARSRKCPDSSVGGDDVVDVRPRCGLM